MKRIPTFLAGMLTAAVIGGLGVGALAASGAVTFNASNLVFNGQQISAKGEGYTLDNGCQAPTSITYTDEAGGGTTYLPVRRIAELLGIEIGWDNATGSVTVTGDVKPTATPDPDTTTPSTDYSDWSAEEEAAYQEFKGMWEQKKDSYALECLDVDRLKSFLHDKTEAQIIAYSSRLGADLCAESTSAVGIAYTTSNSDTVLWEDICLRGRMVSNGYDKEKVLSELG